MINASSMNSATLSQATQVLTSWKDIARYMGKGVRTVQRWEQDFGLPVRRPHSSSKKAVLARPRDLDAWVALRCSSRASMAATQDHDCDILRRLSNLSAEIATSRQLRQSNQELLKDMHSALDRLRGQIISLRSPG